MNTSTATTTLAGRARRGLAAATMAAVLATSPAARAGETLEGAGELAVPGGQVSARVMGLNAAYVGVAEGADALAWNPAGLGSLSGTEAGWHHLTGLDGAVGESIVAALSVGSLGGLALSGELSDQGTFERRDDAGVLQGTYGAGSVGGALGWGRGIMEGVAVGAAVRAGRQTLAGVTYNSVSADVGALWSAMPPLKVGVAVANLGSSGSENSLAMAIRAGASYALDLAGANRLLAAVSADIQPGGANAVSVGVEDTLLSLLAVRAGYRLDLTDQQMTGLTGLTAGLGVTYAGLALDYAFLPSGDLGTSHRVSLTYRKAAEHAPHAESTEGGAK